MRDLRVLRVLRDLRDMRDVIDRIDARALFVNNWGTKLLSLGLTLVLWVYVVTSTGKTEQTLIIPLELRNIPSSMTVVGNVPGNLEVRVQGQERLLRDGTVSRNMVGLLDLSMAKEGENIIRLSPYDISHPAGITVTHMSLSDVKVRLEPLKREAFRLIPVLRGTPAAGYRVAGITATPQKIMIEAPASVMKNLEALETMPIDIQDARTGMVVEPKIDCRGKQVKLLEKDIAVRVNIERVRK
jgi:YbbR domain-containing protein